MGKQILSIAIVDSDACNLAAKQEFYKSQCREVGMVPGGVNDEILLHCPCGCWLELRWAYKCLFCGLWLCKVCATRHFVTEKTKRITELETAEKQYRTAIGLLNSMVCCGEKHSNTSREVVTKALKGDT